MPEKSKTFKVRSDTAKWFGKEVVANYRGGEFELLELLKDCKRKRFLAKEIIYRESDRADSVLAIHSGLVKLLSHLPNGKARIVRLHGKGAWIGLGGLLNQPYEHTAVAIAPVEAFCVPINKLLALKLDEPERFFQLLKKWYEYLCEADIWISSFSTGAIKPRVARLINFLSNIEYGKSSTVVELLTVHEMADILGVTAESVSRILAEFKRGDILHRLENDQSHGLYKLDTQALHNMARN